MMADEPSSEIKPLQPPRNAKGQILPGQSGNPSGRPKAFKNATKQLFELTDGGEKVYKYLVDVLEGTIKAKTHERTEAAKVILDRLLGKPVTFNLNHDLDGSEDVSEVRELASEALMRLAGALGQRTLPSTGSAVVANPDPPREPEQSSLLSDAPVEATQLKDK